MDVMSTVYRNQTQYWLDLQTDLSPTQHRQDIILLQLCQEVRPLVAPVSPSRPISCFMGNVGEVSHLKERGQNASTVIVLLHTRRRSHGMTASELHIHSTVESAQMNERSNSDTTPSLE
jgi:hypothetical protein